MRSYQSLKGKKAFREVLKKGKRFYEGEIQIIVYPVAGKRNISNNNNDTSEKIVNVGIQILKRYGNSVIRNRTKRRIKAICQALLQDVNNNYSIIIRPMEDFKYLKYENSRNIVRTLFKRAGITNSI